MKKHIKVSILVICICVAFLLLIFASLIFISEVAYISNAKAHILMCKKTLEETWRAFELYKKDFNGALPPSLFELRPYMKEAQPKCPGDREEDEKSYSRDYFYYNMLSSKEPRPICWDSKPHRIRSRLLPDAYIWNVLYTDGHVESLNRREFLSLMRSIGIRDPNYP
jgi:hypothetical protein